jgi:predicted metal-dependent peptidase
LLDAIRYGSQHVDADIQELLSACAKQAGYGGLPEYLQNQVDELIKGRKLPWHILLKRYLEAIRGEDFDFLPPDKRMLYSGIILPDTMEIDNSIDNALVVLDVSSSVDRKELLLQLWQIRSVLHEMQFSGSILAFSGCVQKENPLTDKHSLKKFIDELKIGGGTRWDKVVEHVNKLKPTPKPIIVFTDGYFYSFTEGLSNVIFITQGTYPRKLEGLGKVIRVK